MSGVSRGTDSVISAPSGGGGLSGIGEKFSPDLHTGTGNFTVPIALPPGRNGFQPELSLVHSTGQGNGPFGLGWRLDVPGVSRKTSKGVPRYGSDSDTFVLSRSEDLVPVASNDSTTRFRPRTEGTFSRILRHRSRKDDFWEVWSKDGLRSFYGTPGAAGNDPAVVAKPNRPDHVFAWKLTQTVDPLGNRIVYEYERDSASESNRAWDQLYLDAIRYVDFEDSAGSERFLVSVSFTYEDRPDPFSDHRPGFEVRTRRRCTRIETKTHPDAELLVRTIDLTYLDEVADARLPPNEVSLLARIQVFGHDGATTESLPPLDFEYTAFEPDRADLIPVEGDIPRRSLLDPDLELADLDGNGLPDVFELGATARYWRNLGDGRFDLPRELGNVPAGLRFTDPDVLLIDADGDARLDLLVTRTGFSGYFPLRYDQTWDQKSFRRLQQAPSFNLEDPEVRLIDLDGDGVTDAIRSGERLECFFNHSENGWHDTRRVPRRDLEQFPNVNFSDPRVKWADMTGDGLQDVVIVHDGHVDYWPSLGYGNFAPRVHMQGRPDLPPGYDPRRVLLGDIDGDGAADLIYVDHCKVTVWINRSGNGWSEPIEIDGTPPVDDLADVRLADMLGTGVRGLLWSRQSAESGRPHWFFLDFTGRIKPYLLAGMNNNMGAVTKVAYASSTKFAVEDWAARRPWRTPLPFPVQTVRRVEVIDEISMGKLTTEYRYHHGYWDGHEREFRGFGMVEQFDTERFETYDQPGLHGEAQPFERVSESFFSPPTMTRTWFHQGPVDDGSGDWAELDWSEGGNGGPEPVAGSGFWSGDPPALDHREIVDNFLTALPDRAARRDALRTLRSRVLRTELYALDGSDREDRPYTVTEFAYGLREVDSPGATPIFFPHLVRQRTTQWERGDDPMTQLAFASDYDAYGQPRSQISIAVPRGRDYRQSASGGDPYLATHTVTDYSQRDDEDVFIVDRTARSTTREIVNDGSSSAMALAESAVDAASSGPVLSQQVHFYDGETFSGLPAGEMGRHGLLMRTESLVLTQEILSASYPDGDPTLTGGPPPYFDPAGTGAWSDEYPAAFRAAYDRGPADTTRPGLAQTSLGYGIAVQGADPFLEGGGYFVASARSAYDRHGLPVAQRPAMGRDNGDRDTTIEYDAFALLPTRVTDPVGLATEATYDYRVLQPRAIRDPNHSGQEFSFSPLGLPSAVFVRGPNGEGDVGEPSVRFEYGFEAFINSPADDRQPVFVKTVRRGHHNADMGVPAEERDETITTVEYSDGFGRLVQTRAQAEDVVWGDDPVWGNGVLPTDQADEGGTRETIVGHRRAASDPDRVVVSGWTTYDNKGRAVEQFEPFFASGWDHLSREEAVRQRDAGGADLFGRKLLQFYDPRGRVVRTISPDGSEQLVVYGVPQALEDPTESAPTAWEAYTYDANDNAGRTHSDRSASYRHHWNTPSSIEVDALGRTIRSIERNRGGGPNAPLEELTTTSAYDLRGNLASLADPLNRQAFSYRHDLADRTLRIQSIDAGIRRTVIDAGGAEVERRDSKRALVLQATDLLSRPSHLWARDNSEPKVTLRQVVTYGDGGTPTQLRADREAARAERKLGRVVTHYDEAGRVDLAYDFKGNVVDKTRRVLTDERAFDCFTQPGINDWDAAEETLLETDAYRTSTSYDALNRVRSVLYPADVNGDRAELRPTFNRGGALAKVQLDDEVYVEQIAYNARGQRTLVAYGNELCTRYVYDSETFRLRRLHSGRCDLRHAGRVVPTGGKVQDFAYSYDLVGNVLAILERVPGCGVRGNANTAGLPGNEPSFSDPSLPLLLTSGDALFRRFEYDPLYRLVSATGRECAGIPAPRPWDDAPRCGFNSPAHGSANQDNAPDLTTTYTEAYEYDPAGNMLSMTHRTPAASWGRRFGMGGSTPAAWLQELAQHPPGGPPWTDGPGNQLTHVGDNDPNAPQTHFFDDNGNLIGENSERHFEWSHSDRLDRFRIQSGSTDPSVEARYLYDSTGNRVKKVVRRESRVEATCYLDSFFEAHRWARRAQSETTVRLHISDGPQLVALVRRGPTHPDDKGPAEQYHLADHLGSSHVVAAGDGTFVNREEYLPYGETSFGSFGLKRHRFTGREKDSESGLSRHGHRLYAAWLGRWAGCDPDWHVDGLNLFAYVGGAPVGFVDPEGTQGLPVALGASPGEGFVGGTENVRIEKNDQLTLQEMAEQAKKIESPQTRLYYLRINNLVTEAQFEKGLATLQAAESNPPPALSPAVSRPGEMVMIADGTVLPRSQVTAYRVSERLARAYPHLLTPGGSLAAIAGHSKGLSGNDYDRLIALGAASSNLLLAPAARLPRPDNLLTSPRPASAQEPGPGLTLPEAPYRPNFKAFQRPAPSAKSPSRASTPAKQPRQEPQPLSPWLKGALALAFGAGFLLGWRSGGRERPKR